MEARGPQRITSDDDPFLSRPASLDPRTPLRPVADPPPQAYETVPYAAFTPLRMEGIPRGELRCIRWHGPYGEVIHCCCRNRTGQFATACGELVPQPPSSVAVEDVTDDGVITCRRCCRMMLKRNWRGA